MKCLQFSVMDVSVRTTMKGAAKCDKHCELQNSVSRQGPERILCFWDIPKSMPALVFFVIHMMICFVMRKASAIVRASRIVRFVVAEFLRYVINEAFVRRSTY